jgi:hypothetical protein
MPFKTDLTWRISSWGSSEISLRIFFPFTLLWHAYSLCTLFLKITPQIKATCGMIRRMCWSQITVYFPVAGHPFQSRQIIGCAVGFCWILCKPRGWSSPIVSCAKTVLIWTSHTDQSCFRINVGPNSLKIIAHQTPTFASWWEASEFKFGLT